LNYLGYTWTTQGRRFAEAEQVLKKAKKLRPENAYIQDSWGWYLFVRGRTSEAIVELEKAAKLKPDEVTILEHLADAYLRANLTQKAIVQYQEALQFADEPGKAKIQQKIENIRTELARQERYKGEKETRLPAGSEE
jgi:Flp pilus assembly protein TadD